MKEEIHQRITILEHKLMSIEAVVDMLVRENDYQASLIAASRSITNEMHRQLILQGIYSPKYDGEE